MNFVRPIAIHLPQFHSIPENDTAWGVGFTEWTNVRKALPYFEGHYQPHTPHEDVGYYDLSDPDTLAKQADMARAFGIYGFAYYHYWFNGKRLLNTPVDNMLKTGSPDFPFCLIWANEPWTKKWDGSDNEIIQPQSYSPEDDLEHIRFLCKNVFTDKRYITVDEKPVFIVYRTELLPDIRETANIWRNEAKKNGFRDLYLILVENFTAGVNPSDIGFDAALDFAPNRRSFGNVEEIFEGDQFIYWHADYREIVDLMLSKENNYKTFRCVFPSWDNSPRKNRNFLVTTGTSPELFTYFFKKSIIYTAESLPEGEQFVFINAWNEWGEGCHIEPDKKYGYAYLNGIKMALTDQPVMIPSDYLEMVNKSRKELISQNERLREESLKHKSAFASKDYKLGRMMLDPLRKIKRILKGY